MAQRARRPGFILGTVMVLLPVMAIVLIGLVAVLRTGSGTSLGHHAQTSALCVAEAGLADALAELEANPAGTRDLRISRCWMWLGLTA